MARLPQPGGDKNAWGHVANEYLSVSHNPDGTIKPAGIQDAVSTQVETALSVQLVPSIADALAEDDTVAAAAAAAVDAEPRVSSLITDTDALTVDMATAKTDITIISKRRYDIERFGAIGTADDGQTWADAYAQVEAWGGGTIAAPAGEYAFKTPFTIKNGVYTEFAGSGNTKLDFTGLTSKINASAIYGEGALAALPALASDVAKHSRTITFASAPALQPGDVFMIYNPTDYSFHPARAGYRAGEYCKVASVSGSTVTLTTPTYAAYSAADVDVYRHDGIQTGMSGATMVFPPATYGIRTAFGTKLRYDDLDLSGASYAHIDLDRCYDVNIGDVRAFDVNPITGLNYGVMVGNSQRIRLRDCDLETRRHGLTTGGKQDLGCVPNRDMSVIGGRVSGMGTGGTTGVGIHGNTEDVHFIGVQLPDGIQVGGLSGSVSDCTIGSNSAGIAVNASEILSPDWSFDSNTITGNANYGNDFGLFHFPLAHYSVVGGGTLLITNNKFNGGPYTATSGRVYLIRLQILQNVTSLPTGNTIEIVGNTFRTNKPGIDALDFAIYQGDNGGVVGFTSVDVRDNSNKRGLRIQQTSSNPAMFFSGAGAGAPTFRAAKGSTYYRTDGGAGSTLYVNETGSTTWAEK